MENFSSEILINIFEFLDSPAIQNVMEVSKRWSDIVTMTSSLKSKLRLEINANTCEEMAKRSIKFPYKTIKITSNTFDDYPFADFVAYKGELSQVVEFEFVKNIEIVFLDHSLHLNVLELTNINSIFAANMLTSCQNLKELKLDSVNSKHFKDNFYSQDLQTPETIRLNNLKFLEIKSSKDIFSRIEAPNVETLIMHNDPGHDVLRNFLEICWDLKNLVINDFYLRSVRRPQTLKFKLEKFEFKLKHCKNMISSIINNRLAFELIMNNIRHNFHEHMAQMQNQEGRNLVYEQHAQEFRQRMGRNQQAFLANNILNFLAVHKESLRELSINFCELNVRANAILGVIFTEFRLTKLCIKSNYNTLDLTIPRASNSIETLEILGTFSFEDLKEIISKCTAVTNLTINLENNVDLDILSVISSYMKNLKTLEVNTFFATITETTKLEKVENLKILEVSSMLGQNVWHKIAQACPNVINLMLVDNIFEIDPKNLQKVMKELTKVENLELVGKSGFLNLKDVCSLCFDESCIVKIVRIVGKIHKARFNEEIADVAKITNTRITVFEV